MLKLTQLKKLMSRVTPDTIGIVKVNFNTLWEDYHRKTEFNRLQWQKRQISLTIYRKLTKHEFKHLRDSLKGLVKTVSF